MSRPKGSKNKAKHTGGEVQTAVNTLLTTGLITPKVDRLEELLDWGPKIEAFCEKKGFPPSELIEKFEQLERDKLFAATQLGEMIANSSHVTFKKDMTPHEILEEFGIDAYNKAIAMQNKPNTDPQIENEGKTTGNQKKAKDGAENKPAGLSPFLKARQNLKNGIK